MEKAVIYLVCAPKNKLDRKERVSGWRFVPLPKESRKELATKIEPLKGQEIDCVVSSDLDREAAEIVGTELKKPVRTDFGLRRFNVGRHHAAPNYHVERILSELEEKWAKNPDIPIKGGDSWTSYGKRVIKNFKKLSEKNENIVFVTDERTIRTLKDQTPHGIVLNGNAINPDKILVVKRV